MKRNNKDYIVECVDGAKGILSLPDKSIKLVYGSPPYPNADRNYGNWSSAEYMDKISPFIDAACAKLRDDGFLVINVKANREKPRKGINSTRSLIVEKLAIELEERWHLYCVDIEIWIKDNPVPTGLRVACQDAYEQNLWFSVSPQWKINIDDIRREYVAETLKAYAHNEFKPRANGLSYVRKAKHIKPNPKGALPLNVIKGSVSSKQSEHQAVQPGYLPAKYIKACTQEGDLVVDPWLGSGTTGYECLRLGRRFAGYDISKEYVEYSSHSLDILSEELAMVSKISKQRESIQRKFVQSLGSAVVEHSALNERPLKLKLSSPIPIELLIYAFPATNPPGGRSIHEYKFNLNVPNQEKGQRGNFDSSAYALLVSYVEDYDVFVLYDAEKHKNFSYNANVQCKDDLILRAMQEKVARGVKTNGEVLYAARAEYLSKAIKARLIGE